MQKVFKIFLIVFISCIVAGCNLTEAKLDTFRMERERINNEVATGQLDSVEFESGMYWLKNGRIEKIYVYQGDGENFASHEDFFLIEDRVFAVEKRIDNYPDNIHYKAHVYFNDSLIIGESYWVSDKPMSRQFFESELKEKDLTFENEILRTESAVKTKGELSSKDIFAIFQINLPQGSHEKQNVEENEKLKDFRDIQLQLIGSTEKMSNVYLGKPDVNETYFGHINKNFSIYYDIVKNPNGPPKHLVLFLRRNQQYIHDDIEEMYAISDNERACFGIHCLKIQNHEISTNVTNLIERGYKQLTSD
jgi:hypothetical protein